MAIRHYNVQVPDFNPSAESRIFDDFELAGGRLTWTATNTGAGAGSGTSIANDGSHPGTWHLGTGTTATGVVARYSNAASTAIILGLGTAVYETTVQFSALSTAAEEYTFRIGFLDTFSTGAAPVDGVSFVYDRVVSGDYWVTQTSSNSSRTTKVLDGTAGNPTKSVSATTWYNLRAEVDATAGTVNFYINHVLVSTHTTNIPSGAGREMGEGLTMVRTAYTSTQKFVDWDMYYRSIMFTTQR